MLNKFFLFGLILFTFSQLLGAFVIQNLPNSTEQTAENEVDQFLDESFADSVLKSIVEPLDDTLSSEILESFARSDDDLPASLSGSLKDPGLTNISESLNEVLLQNATEFLSDTRSANIGDSDNASPPNVQKPSNDSDSANFSESSDGRISVNSSESNLNKNWSDRYGNQRRPRPPQRKTEYDNKRKPSSGSNFGNSPIVIVIIALALIVWCAFGCPNSGGSYSSRRSSYSYGQSSTSYRNSSSNNNSSSTYVSSGYANTSYRNDDNTHTSSGYATTSFR